MDVHAFSPLDGTACVGLAVTASNNTKALAGAGSLSSGNVLIVNIGPNTAFIRFGSSSSVVAAETTTSTDNDMAIPSGFVGTFDCPGSITHIAAICASAETATVFATRGFGN